MFSMFTKFGPKWRYGNTIGRILYLMSKRSMIAVISCDGTMLGLYTSQVNAWKIAKPMKALMWRCVPNSDVCTKIE